MQTRSTSKKETEEDSDSILWDAESIFDPPQHHFKSHAVSKSCGNEIASSNHSLFPPLQSLEDAKELANHDMEEEEEHDDLSFKSSLSKDMGDCCDASFSDYLGIGGHSLKGSPVSNIHTMGGHDLSLGNIMPFSSSPLQDEKGAEEHCIMNEALGMSFDFNESSAIMGTMNSCVQKERGSGAARMDFSRVEINKSGSPCSLSTPPRR